MLNKTVSVWERRGNLGLDIAKSRARLRGDRKKKKKKKKLARIFASISRQRSLGHNSTFDRMELCVDGYRSWRGSQTSLVRNLGPYYEGNLLERLQITIFPGYASTDDRFTSETGIIVGGTARYNSAWLLLHVDEGKRAKSAVSRRCGAWSYSHQRREIFREYRLLDIPFIPYIFFSFLSRLQWKRLRKKFSCLKSFIEQKKNYAHTCDRNNSILSFHYRIKEFSFNCQTTKTIIENHFVSKR